MFYENLKYLISYFCVALVFCTIGIIYSVFYVLLSKNPIFFVLLLLAGLMISLKYWDFFYGLTRSRSNYLTNLLKIEWMLTERNKEEMIEVSINLPEFEKNHPGQSTWLSSFDAKAIYTLTDFNVEHSWNKSEQFI